MTEHQGEPEPYVTYGHLQKFGDGLESRIDKKIDTMGASLASAIGDLKHSFSAAMEERNRPLNPAWIFGGFGALGVLLGLWVNPVAERANANQARLDNNTTAINQIMADRFTDDDGDRLVRALMDRIEATEGDLAELHDQVADRDLKLEYWRGVNDHRLFSLEQTTGLPARPPARPSDQ